MILLLYYCAYVLMQLPSPMTGTSLEELLRDLGLEHHLKKKLTLSQVLQIDGETLSDESIQSLKSLPWCFLRKLMMVNESFRRMSCSSEQDTEPQSLDSLLNTMNNPQDHSNRVNPLDLITAVFLCSDGFLQQEMALKMSMCQFSVPLLLPKCDTQQCTLMLWAMRDIVKTYKPHSLDDPRGFVEESIVLSDLPMVSFVGLGNSSMSKSHILNQVLSNPQQYQDTFVHKNMECGDTPRRISNGLVEISWYLPSGNKNTDIFSEPLAIANLRGDLRDFEIQYAFLCHTSTAIFVFCDDFKFEQRFLEFKTHWILITNSQSQTLKKDDFRKFVSETKPSDIIIKHPGRNDAEFNKKLCSAICGILKGNIVKMSIERMSDVADDLGIHADEDYVYCMSGRQKADDITGGISDIPSFKEKELPLQGTAWKQLAKLEKEQCRMKNAGEKNIEVYQNELEDQRQKLREQQRAHSISDSMSRFISAMCSSTEESKYFLKWMRINLDNLSRKSLPPLRAKYKEQCQSSSENKELIAQLDREISSCSLGTEHFLREMGQLYESACSLPEALTPEIKRLPRLCAKLLQEGFPLELVDGDSSNIPLEWVTQVLKELHHLTQDKCKIRVISVLGVRSTGKSTLLNTMFGVQFAVSSGRCTRGAFMLLLRVKEYFKVRLGCDYIMIIDTEGLKAPQLAQLDDSHEHDNELATLVVGLSDITVINIAMENSTEMNDILQIVVHAFLRMKEVGRKPCCQFVHQNVPDISAHDSNMRDRKLLLEQLNKMTQAAAKMEKKGNNKTFTDVMEYDPERNTWYIPGLWHGNPPMAAVNVGYSESVNRFKRSVIEKFMEQKSGDSSAHTIIEFLEWTKSLWQAVKYENFIFSFRNSPVAEAYAQLCTEFNQWDWAFRKNMYSWLMEAETKVSNVGTEAEFNNLDELLIHLTNEAFVELTKGETLILANLTEFYNRQEGHIHLVVKYKEDLNITAKTIRRETENSVKNKLEAAVEIRKGMFRLESIKNNQTATMEKKVQGLIEKCRKSKDLNDEQLVDEFEKMWKETVAELWFPGMEERDIVQNISHQLWVDLEMKGSSFKQQYYTDFKDLFNKRHQCQKKANAFTVNCLQPAVKEYITKSLGPDLVDEMLAGQKAIAFSTRAFFQFSVLEQLLKNDNFQDFVRYIENYETFEQDWILKLMVKQFSEGDSLRNIEMNRLKVVVRKIKEAIKTSQMKAAEQAARRGEETQNIQQFIQDICSDLVKELIIPKDPLRAVLALNTAKPEDFSRCLQVFMDEMEQAFTREFQKDKKLHHPYKDYRSIYPDWLIQPDTSIQASDYWKYIFSKFNKQFAEEYEAKPADIPPQWRYITLEQAAESLKKSFLMKTGD
ncbi:up-regulator of cell proliferation-like [Conger conger]|uniref:up-regulator of cell proliferation-like n=1 Tax=Conger conger TaxID=82655 RepID=UPI002A5A8A7B|nr:up-regulator of cell proliferation-like [Conger conger]